MKLFSNRWLQILIAFSACLSSFGQNIQTKSSNDDAANLCPDPTFSNGERWRSSKEGKLAPGEGVNGNTALLLQRTDPKSYPLVGLKIKGLKPKTVYNFGVWVKGEKIRTAMKGMDQRGGTVCIEFYYKGKYISGGAYPKGVYGTKNWTLVKGKVITPQKFDKAVICFYLGKYTVGKAWFYAPYVRQDLPSWKVGLLCPVMNYAVNPGKQKLILSSFLYGLKPADFMVDIALQRNGKVESRFSSPIINNRVRFSANLENGTYLLKLQLKNQKQNKTYFTRDIPLRVLSQETVRPKNAVFVDNRGRTWVNGKKFLPVGIYTNQQSKGFKQWGNRWRQVDTENLKKSGFNCIMPYDCLSWKMAGSKLSGIDAQREVMDELNRNGIKVIFSVKDIRHKWDKWQGAKGMKPVVKKVVEAFREHPALLAWYVNDERGVEPLDLEKRETIGMLDPFHPTWQVQCFYYKFDEYQGASDVFGVDPYPIVKNGKDMKLIRKNMNLAMRAVGFDNTIALWAVPQVFPWSHHRGFEKPCWPTENQIRSMSLLMAIMGARGFVMYSYMDLFTGGGDDFKKYWPGVCNSARMLNEIAPFLLGDPVAPQVEMKIIKGDVKAKAFTADNGKTCVLIAAIGPGPAEAVIKISGGDKLKSRYGRSTLNQNGTWIFKGNNIDCDVLFPVK